MRDDFYSRFAADAPPEVLAWTQHGFFQVGSELGKEELQEIISEPAWWTCGWRKGWLM